MKTKTLITTVAKMAAIAALVATSHAITIGDTVGYGESAELGGVQFTVDYGSVAYVSDLSNGALRFDRTDHSYNTSISAIHGVNDDYGLVINGQTELLFEWSVNDQSDTEESSFYMLDGVKSTFHDGIGVGISSGTISRLLEQGTHLFSIKTTTQNQEASRYVLTVGNLRLNPLYTVSDSPLGFFGIATIFAFFVVGRRFSGKKTS